MLNSVEALANSVFNSSIPETRVASTQSRTKYFDMSYAPFGENYNNSGTTDYNFTGQNQDTEAGYTGYDDFRFREYSPGQGRWLSPDPAGIGAVNPVNPQSWNRYAYVLNNPLILVDPLGLDCVYLSDDGQHVEEIDKEVIDDGECASTGGYFVDGEVSSANSVFINYEAGSIDAYSVSYYNGLDEVSTAYGADNPGLGAWTQRWYISGPGGITEIPGPIGPIPVGGGGGGAANNGQPQTPTGCAGQALWNNGVSIALDAAGVIPGVGNLVSGDVAVAKSLSNAYTAGTALVSTGHALLNSDFTGATASGTSFALAVGNGLLGSTKAIPIAGNIVSFVILGYDAYKAYKQYYQCKTGG